MQFLSMLTDEQIERLAACKGDELVSWPVRRANISPRAQPRAFHFFIYLSALTPGETDGKYMNVR